jgi:NADP-dependent 3-hydroxy acid dehydrogenase YdfG
MRTILITGASSGIGKACAEKLASAETQLILCSRNIDKLQNLKNELESKAASISIYKVDVQKMDSVESMFKDLDERKINVDTLISNAGLALGLSDVENGDISDWDMMIDTNIKGLLYVTKLSLRHMVKNNFGHIVNMGSIAGVYAYPKGAVYAATKSAVKFISDGLRKEVVDKNIKVTNIQPGLVETNFSNVRFHGDLERANDVYRGIKPLTADDIADTVSYVISMPQHVQICEITITPLHQASVDVVYRE